MNDSDNEDVSPELKAALESGITGFSGGPNVDGAYTHGVHFRNGHIEEITNREKALIEGAWVHGYRQRPTPVIHVPVVDDA